MTSRITGLDLVRVFALFAVVLHHVGIPLLFFRENGWFGMDILFALSSYFLTKSIIDNPGVLLKTIFLKRILTIWPLYFFYLLVIGHFDQTWPYMLFAGNWWVIRHGWSEFNLIGHMWALSLIEQFYFIWAVVLTKINTRHLVKIIITGLIISFFAKVALFTPGNYYPIYMNTLARLDPFLWGALLAVTPVKVVTKYTGALLGLCVFMLATINVREGSLLTVLLGYPLIGICSMLLVHLGTQINKGSFRLISDISKWGFGIYIWHKIVIDWAFRLSDIRSVQTGIVLFGSVLIAAVTYNLIQWPFIKFKSRNQVTTVT